MRLEVRSSEALLIMYVVPSKVTVAMVERAVGSSTVLVPKAAANPRDICELLLLPPGCVISVLGWVVTIRVDISKLEADFMEEVLDKTTTL